MIFFNVIVILFFMGGCIIIIFFVDRWVKNPDNMKGHRTRKSMKMFPTFCSRLFSSFHLKRERGYSLVFTTNVTLTYSSRFVFLHTSHELGVVNRGLSVRGPSFLFSPWGARPLLAAKGVRPEASASTAYRMIRHSPAPRAESWSHTAPL